MVNIITKKRQKGFDASAQLGGYDEGDGFTQNYQLSWGNGSDGPPVRDRRKLCEAGLGQLRRSWALAVSEPYTDACQATCSSFTPNGRFALPGIFPGP